MNGGGDVLARGGKTATFGVGQNVSQERWDAIWAEDAKSEREIEQMIIEAVDKLHMKLKKEETINGK